MRQFQLPLLAVTRVCHVRRSNFKLKKIADNKINFHGQGLEIIDYDDGECVKGEKVKYQWVTAMGSSSLLLIIIHITDVKSARAARIPKLFCVLNGLSAVKKVFNWFNSFLNNQFLIVLYSSLLKAQFGKQTVAMFVTAPMIISESVKLQNVCFQGDKRKIYFLNSSLNFLTLFNFQLMCLQINCILIIKNFLINYSFGGWLALSHYTI